MPDRTDRDEIRLTYRIETSGDPEAIAAKIASDQSTGTFTALPGETEEVQARCAARVLSVTPLEPTGTPSLPDPGGSGPYHRADAVIAFPLEARGHGYRGPDDHRDQRRLRHPRRHRHSGHGCRASRGLVLSSGPAIRHRRFAPPDGRARGTDDRLDHQAVPRSFAERDRVPWWPSSVKRGVDFVKDDEKLMSPGYSPLADRIAAIMPVIDAHAQKTGKRVMYAFGISSADPDTMMRNHDMVLEAGGNAAVININSIGYGGMSFLRKRSGLCLHAHRNGWDVLTRHPRPRHGVPRLPENLAAFGR